MTVFDLHSSVLGDYRDFVRSFFTVTDERARAYIDKALGEEAQLWPEFLPQVSPFCAISRGLLKTPDPCCCHSINLNHCHLVP